MPVIRFTGMASGLDTENMVKELMKAHKEPMNRIIRTKQRDEWKQDAYREMNSLLMELRTSVDTLRFSGNFNKKKATSENDSIASVNVVGTPKLSSYAVEVTQLAKAEMPAAAQFSVNSSITNTTAKIGSSFDLEVNGKTVQVIGNTDTIDSLNTKLSTAGAGVEAKLVDGKIIFTSVKDAALSSEVVGSETKYFFNIKASGANDLGISTTTTKSSYRTAGQDAKAVINGIEYTSKSNKITFDGVEFTLKQENDGAAINVTNGADEDAIFNTIKDFVTKYNDIIAKINTKISEPKYKDYEPLLDEEKEALPDKTAEKMENMAKSGLLLRDSILKNGLDEMRNAISTQLSGSGVNSAFDTLSEIGIGGPPNGKFAYLENGKLYIDETKLRAAIRNNGADVQKLFTQYSSSTDASTKYKESGLAERLYDLLTKTINKVTKEAGSSTSTSTFDDSFLGRKIKDEEDEIDRWEDRLQEMEDRYYKQFASMETMMSKAQSQSSWFAQMLGQ